MKPSLVLLLCLRGAAKVAPAHPTRTRLTRLVACAVLTLMCSTCPVVSAQTAQRVAREVIPSVLTLEVFDAGGGLISRGSAFFVTRDVVATSYHVLEGGHSAYARTTDRFELPRPTVPPSRSC